MTTGIIELNDAGLRLSVDNDILLTSPGYAVLDGKRLLVGTEGQQNARLLPRWTNNRFWSQLNTDPMPNATPAYRHHADLAFSHLESIWQTAGKGIDDIIFAVPGFYTREQLSLLLGMAQECGILVSGVVDTSIAAAARLARTAQVLHLDIFLHRITLTVMKADASLQRTQSLTVAETGLFTLLDRWANIVAGQFIQSSRYDPMHQAESEQRLFNALPAWIAARGQRQAAAFELDTGSARHEVSVSNEQLLQACSTIYPQIVQLLRQHANGETQLLLSDRFTGFPGLKDSIALVADLQTENLDPNAVVNGINANLNSVAAGNGNVSHVTSLPLNHSTRAAVSRPNRATHILFGNHAYTIGAAFHIAGIEGTGIVTADTGAACTLYSRGGETHIDVHDTARVRINDADASGSSVLAPGDKLSIDGSDLTMITVSG